VDLCGCLPSCGQKECGDDGCGGVCGACDVDQLCVAGECKANVCQPDPCSGHGTCHLPDATCTCETGYAGAHCSQCDSGYAGYPDCVPASCAAAATSCSGHGACVPASGACACDAGFTGAKCDACLTGHGTYPNCTP
jgi:laminin alpha 3/5